MLRHLLAHIILLATSMAAALCIISGVITPSIASIVGAWILVFGGLVAWHELRRERHPSSHGALRTGMRGKFRCIDGGAQR